MKDYYKILGVEKSASENDIKQAFRRLAHQHHPDKNGGNADKFKEINEAYQVLGNKEKRSQYDQFGSTFEQAGGGFGGFGGGNPFQGFDFSQARGFGGDFGDFDMGDLFGSFFGGSGGRRSRQRRGQDIQVDIEVSLKDIVHGVTRTLNLRKKNACDKCDGTGAKNSTSFKECQTCQGRGFVTATILGQFQTQTTCPECTGTGKIIKDKCSHCHGGGTTDEDVSLRVDIPSGIEEGQSIRISGQGNGIRGGKPGDLFVRVHITDSAGFTRDGDDLVTEYDIPFTLAALGGEIPVKTIDGQVSLKIPAGTPSGKKFMLRNKGIGHLRSNGRGNQIVIVNVEVPKKLSKKQKKILEELDSELKKDKKWF